MNAVALSELLVLIKGISALAIHDSHKLNILNAVVSGVEAAAAEYLTGHQDAPQAALSAAA